MSADIDEDFLMEWSQERQKAAWDRQHSGGDKCPSCGHAEHGVVCRFASIFTHCECPSSRWEAAS